MSMLQTTEPVRASSRFEELAGDAPDPAITIARAPSPATIESPARERFWRRQFGSKVTRSQRHFDWTFGFILPLICFYFDPIVFRYTVNPAEVLLGQYAMPAYIVGFLTTMSLVTFLLWREKLGSASVIPASVLSIGSVIALLIGIVIFPYSLLGALFLIGFLGFTPLFTAFAYMRNAVRAFRAAAGDR